MTNPVLNWLRDVALEVIRERQTGAWLRAGDLVDLRAETGTETPGLPEHGDQADPDTRKTAQQATGRKLSQCFRISDVLADDMTVRCVPVRPCRNALTRARDTGSSATRSMRGGETGCFGLFQRKDKEGAGLTMPQAEHWDGRRI